MNILLFTGYSASGKSTLAERINVDLKYKFFGERNIIHNLAVERGYSRSRYWLQAEGITCMVNAVRSETLQLIRESQQSRGIIIDGAYDREIVPSINGAFPESRLVIISVIVGKNIREERMRHRLRGQEHLVLYELKGIDYFKREAGIEEIMKEAEIIIDNSNTIEESTISLSRDLELRRII